MGATTSSASARRAGGGAGALFDVLVESGYCMLDFGASRPASGAEHHYSHFWEMKLLHEGPGHPARRQGGRGHGAGGRPVLPCAFACRVSRRPTCWKASTLPDRGKELDIIRAAYGSEADEVSRDQARFLDLTESEYDASSRRILDMGCRPGHRRPGAAGREVAKLLETAGGPSRRRPDRHQQRGEGYGHCR